VLTLFELVRSNLKIKQRVAIHLIAPNASNEWMIGYVTKSHQSDVASLERRH